MHSTPVAALYCRKSSIYRLIPGVEVFDEQRDALTFGGGVPVVAHPPCGPWGKLSHFSKDGSSVRDLGLHAIRMVRRWGGVLEHPSTSRLFAESGVDVRTGQYDEYGGFVVVCPQVWFGHRAEKLSAFYICGVGRSHIPRLPLSFEPPVTTVERMGKAERERTPLELATWLVAVARMASVRVPA